MTRVVLDTNIIISGRLWGGAPRQVMQAIGDQKFKPIISEALLEELTEVLGRPKFAERLQKIERTPAQIVEEYLQVAEVVEPVIFSQTIVEADPDDDAVIACAVGGQADAVVTGNIHLLNLGSYETIPIWDVHQFLAFLSD